MKKSVLSLLLICILIFSAGCQAQKGPEGGTGLLSGDELELYTSQFGLPLEQVKENLSFSDLKLTDEVHGTWEVSEKRTINGLEFSLNLIENPFDNSLYEYVYGCSLLDDNARETGFSIASQAMEIYGAPSTYPGISTRIFTEEGELKEPEPSEDEFSETWQISEEVQFKLSIFLFDEQTIINLSYSNQTEEWQPRQWKDNK